MLVTLMDTTERKKYFFYSVLIGLFHALACFYWLTALLLAPSIALGIIIITRDFDIKNRIIAAFLYGVALMIFLFVPLVIAAVFSSDVSNFSEFRTWLSYAAHNIPPQLSLGNFLRGIFGFSSSIFRMTEFGPFIKNALFGVPFVLKGTAYLVAEITAFGIIWLVIAFNAFYFIRRRKEFLEQHLRLILAALLWAAPPVIFGLVWLGSDTERWLAVTPILWLLLIIPVHYQMKRSDKKGKGVMGHVLHTLVVVLFCYNLVIAVIPDHDPETNHYMKAAEALNEQMTPQDLVVIWGYDHTFTGADLTYFFRQDCIHLSMFGDWYREKTEEKLIERFTGVFERQGRVFVIGRVFLEKDLPESRFSADEHKFTREQLRQFLTHWERREAFTYKKDTYWELYLENKP